MGLIFLILIPVISPVDFYYSNLGIVWKGACFFPVWRFKNGFSVFDFCNALKKGLAFCVCPCVVIGRRRLLFCGQPINLGLSFVFNALLRLEKRFLFFVLVWHLTSRSYFFAFVLCGTSERGVLLLFLWGLVWRSRPYFCGVLRAGLFWFYPV